MLPHLYIIITRKEYERLCKLFEANERISGPLDKEFGFKPQLEIKGIPLFTREQVKYLKQKEGG